MISIDFLNKWPDLEKIKFKDIESARVAEIILDSANDEMNIDNDSLSEILSKFSEYYELSSESKITRKQLKMINDVISQLEGIITSTISYDRSPKTIRPTVISPNSDEAQFRAAIKTIANETPKILKSKALIDSDELYVRLLIEVGVTTGLPLNRAESFIQELLKSPFECSILVPSGEPTRADKCLPVTASNTARFICVCLHARNYEPPNHHKLAKHTISSLLTASTKVRITQKIKLKTFYPAAASLFCIFGTEAIIYSRLSGLSLPIAPTWADMNGSIVGLPSEEIYTRERNKRTFGPAEKTLQQIENEKSVDRLYDENLDDDEKEKRFLAWQELAYYFLGHIRYWIKKQTQIKNKGFEIEFAENLYKLNSTETLDKLAKVISKKTECNEDYIKYLTYATADKMQETLQLIRPITFPPVREFLPMSNQIPRKICAISLMFAFAYNELVIKKNKTNTILSKLSSIFSQSLFDYEPASNIENWDEEDASLFIHEVLLNPEFAPSTNQNRLSQFSTLLSFSRKMLDIWSDVYFPISSNGQITTTNRNQILGQQEFDLFINAFEHHPDIQSDITVSTVIFKILFYAGLRPGELARLTLGDISAHSVEEILIRVRRFKTPASRRIIPLHLLAPPEVCLEIFDYISERLSLFRKLKSTRAFGEGRKPSAAREDLLNIAEVSDEQTKFLRTFPLFSNADKATRIAREEMKLILGEGADLYLLRHSYATHMFLRWYAMRYPDVINELRDRTEWFYSNEAMTLQRHIYRHGNLVNHSKETDMVHLMKSMGHRFVDTFFAVYCHSYFVAYNHAQEKYMVQRGWENLPVSVGFIQANFPKMKSRTSVAQFQTKTLAGVLDFFSTRLG
ncbi:MAG: hypothetical protein KJ609_18490 [Gammaproteobacteria bacterium]|nr:hypothetical protein [Gammaproteobacteria bacterium]MBU2239966.1 hypothetical protein [Gammaproteobacteria bacterium]MBU2320543.1 hypothetical protein [Gammaproteobacteria bacterium]MBU2412758.1 hypothetical protein [Gammaproteobacteria bacterium]